MREYEFTVVLVAEGESPEEAWAQAVEDMREHAGSGTLGYAECMPVANAERR